MSTLSADELRAARLAAQSLAEPANGAVDVVRRLIAVQAQAVQPARLSVRARTDGLIAADVDSACATGELVRGWAMRGTLHMVCANDFRWILDLFGERFLRADRRRRWQLGLDDATCERALTAIEVVLRGQRLTRAALIERIAEYGIPIDKKTQAPAHLVMFAALSGLICRGPEAAGDEPTYVLLDEWVPSATKRDEDDALADLARRYLVGHGPATVDDFVGWSGLLASQGKRAFAAIADECEPVTVEGRTFVALASSELTMRRCPPKLLAHFDPLLLGYADRDLVLDPLHGKEIQAGGGMIRPAVLVGGRVIGSWRLDRSRKRPKIVVDSFDGIAVSVRDALRAEADDIARFLGEPLDFTAG